MKILRNLFAATVICLSILLATTATAANTANAFTTQQKAAIEEIIHQYLLNNPDILLEAYRSLQKRERQRMMQKAQKAIPANATKLFDSSTSPIVGNPQGNVTLVEFFDYQCGYCRQMASVMQKLIEQDKNLRVVYKDFPIIDPMSEVAAKAVLAARKQNKYEAFHNALLKLNQRLDTNLIMQTAKAVGINIKKLEQDMEDDNITGALAENMQLAQELNLMGTPAFVIASYPVNSGMKYFFVPGFTDEATLKKFIAMARK